MTHEDLARRAVPAGRPREAGSRGHGVPVLAVTDADSLKPNKPEGTQDDPA